MKKYQIGLNDKKIIKDQSLLRHEEIKNRILVLPELEAFIPPLLPEEYNQLEANIKKEGCREALLIWETTEAVAKGTDSDAPAYVLIDGHNRYAICNTHQIDFKIHLVQFPTKEAVYFFMIENQLGRRNLTPEQASYLRGLRYRTERQAKGKYDRSGHKGQNDLYAAEELENHKGQFDPYASEEGQVDHKGQNVPYEKGTTSGRLAERFNVSEKTIKRDAEFSQGIDKLTPELKKDVLSGKVKISKGDIQQLASLPVESLPTLDAVSQALARPAPEEKAEIKEDPEVLMNQLRKKLSQLTRLSEPNDELLNSIIRIARQLKSKK
ncbi:ParB N-terminal domain-containing protein [Siphonobacter curvatus]|uniref:ParB/Sulfiredoxin domain-containing protein n=1 Tax=Siphonobacter curvatus TaxID=2094562 RepID=A0A2S7IHL5_9BACT|nr:hypothetical protein [Siphonobacter curvatus]PQA55484.1 hypothetical protein C5O19_18860 [Siphonobacter curvatus]